MALMLTTPLTDLQRGTVYPAIISELLCLTNVTLIPPGDRGSGSLKVPLTVILMRLYVHVHSPRSDSHCESERDGVGMYKHKTIA